MTVKTRELVTKVWIIGDQVRIEARANGVFMTCNTGQEPVSIGTDNVDDVRDALAGALQHAKEQKERHGSLV